MSWQPCPDPVPGDTRAADLIETVIIPRARDIGGFEVRRALPPPPDARLTLHDRSQGRSTAPAVPREPLAEGAHSLIEVAGGLLLHFLPHEAIAALVRRLTFASIGRPTSSPDGRPEPAERCCARC